MSTLSEEIDAMVNRLDTNGSKFVSIAMQGSITILLKKLKEALERNERDAERYHWFRMAFVKDDDMEEFNNALSEGCYTPEDVDARVDSARAGGEGK